MYDIENRTTEEQNDNTLSLSEQQSVLILIIGRSMFVRHYHNKWIEGTQGGHQNLLLSMGCPRAMRSMITFAVKLENCVKPSVLVKVRYNTS